MEYGSNMRSGNDTRLSAGVRSAVASFFLTLALFLVMPFVELWSNPAGRELLVVPAEVVSLPVSQPPPPRLEQPVKKAERPKPRPELEKMRRQLTPLAAAMNLDVELGNIAGDFDVSFRMTGPDLTEASGISLFDLADIDSPPRPVARLRPAYPPHARMRSIEGFVVVEFTVGPEGRTRDLAVISSFPEGTFEGAAEMAVKRWRFKPGTKDGKAVPVRIRQKIRFDLVE